jgi:hypothetical protein
MLIQLKFFRGVMRTNGIYISLIHPIEFFQNFLGYSNFAENYGSEDCMFYWRSIAYFIFAFHANDDSIYSNKIGRKLKINLNYW